MDERYFAESKIIEQIKNAYCKDCAGATGKRCGMCNIDAVISAITDIPAADVVEVVRCKDCRWWIANTGIADRQKGHCFEHGVCTNGYVFCSCGERKNRDDNNIP